MKDPRPCKPFGRALPPAESLSTAPDWQQADPAWIERSLQHSQSLPRSGWMVVDAMRAIRRNPRRYRIAGSDYVVWRSAGGVRVASEACPHMGASLEDAKPCKEALVCPWHGLHLGPAGHGAWRHLPTFDDGVLLWVALDGNHAPQPILPKRPARHFDAVIRKEARCEPEDIIANRLDPWHGAHFHPYSFGHLKVIEQDESSIVVRVVYRVIGSYGVEVDARFACPDPATIVMTIVRGEGEGSVVETHATPIESGQTAVVEATLATSDRPQFWAFSRGLPWLLRPMVRAAARRLWEDDAAYAERRFALRTGLRVATAIPAPARPEDSLP